MSFSMRFLGFALVLWALALSSASGQTSKKENFAKKRPRARQESRSARGSATTVQLPTFGVSVDANGVLAVKIFPDATGQLMAQRRGAARASLGKDVFAWSDLRKVSLCQLEQAIRRRLADGNEPDETMRHLAGLQRLQFVFFYPDSKDIVIAGPAEGWIPDLSGRIVGVGTGRPVLLLEDLLVALRQYTPGSQLNPFVGCTIGPDRQSLIRYHQFRQTIPKTVRQSERAAAAVRIANGARQALGLARIGVFSISDRTHFAQVLIEADYRMKCIAVGVEPPPVKMMTFIGAVTTARDSNLQRWWFTPNYDCVRVTPDRLAMELVGQAVQLQTEDKVIRPDGRIVDSGAKPGKAAIFYSTSFTRKYAEIARVSPVFAQMRNQIDMLVAAAYIRNEDFYGQAGWRAETLLDEAELPVETFPKPQRVHCVVNAIWKRNRLVSPAGGGVSIMAHEALSKERLMWDKDGELGRRYADVRENRNEDRWWWD
jgi:hypothetical protein